MTSTKALTRVGLIHATQVAMAPVERAFLSLWPDADRFNVLDDALAADFDRARGELTAALSDRIEKLARYAVGNGANGLLYTCSSFGQAIERVADRLDIPVLKPNEAMYQAAFRAGTRIGMIVTFAPSIPSMTEEFNAMRQALGVHATLETICVPDAIVAARAGDIARHDRLVAEAAPSLAHCDALMLAHFSTATALQAVQARVTIPVISAPEAAVSALKARLQVCP